MQVPNPIKVFKAARSAAFSHISINQYRWSHKSSKTSLPMIVTVVMKEIDLRPGWKSVVTYPAFSFDSWFHSWNQLACVPKAGLS
jgi:hypothetical protein